MNATLSRASTTAWPSLPRPIPLAAVMLLHLAGLSAVWLTHRPVQPTPAPTVQVRFIHPTPPPPPLVPTAKSPPPAVIAAAVQTPAAVPLQRVQVQHPPALAEVPAPPVLPTPAEKTAPSSPSRVTSAKARPAPEKTVPPRFVAAYLDNPPPAYPPGSRSRGEQGTVRLRVKVGVDGHAEQVEIQHSSGFFRLDRAAARVVRERWRFEPARRGGEPIAAWVVVPIQFELE